LTRKKVWTAQGGIGMESTLFFIGAGGAVDFGFYDTGGFFKEVEKRIQKGEIITDELQKAIFKSIHEYLDVHNKRVDIEQILFELYHFKNFLEDFGKEQNYKDWLFLEQGKVNLSQMDPDVLEFRKFLEKYLKALDKLEKAVNGLVHEFYSKEPDKKCKNVYRKLIKDVMQPVSIFTTNYDLCIEAAFSEDTTFYDGFCENDGTLVWRPELFGSHKYNLRLYKLHGSVDWTWDESGDGGKIYRKVTDTSTDGTKKLLIYPGFKDTPHEEPLVFMHEKLREVLIQSQVCVVIGFAFRDEYINSIFKETLGKNKILKIINWNSSPEQIPAFLKKRCAPFKGRFPTIGNTFNEKLKRLKEFINPKKGGSRP
jgi:hypothetical protein